MRWLVLVLLAGCSDQLLSPIDAGEATDAPVTAPVSWGMKETGDPCTGGGECASGTCLHWRTYRDTDGNPTSLDFAILFPGGYCSSEGCTDGRQCSYPHGFCLLGPTGERNYCVKRCRSDLDCRENYRCWPTFPYLNRLKYCGPDPIRIRDWP